MDTSQFGDQLDSIHSISVEIASLRELPDIYDRTLTYSLALTSSDLSFLGLLSESKDFLELPAVKGTFPFDLDFYDRFHHMPVRDSVFGVTLTQRRSHISNDVAHDPHRVGQPTGHPPVGMFLGVPLRVGDDVIGMVGVANKPGGYTIDDERLLSTFANQVAVAIDNARLYRRRREMIVGLQQLHERLGEAERDQLLTRERERIAAALHDSIQQSLFTIGAQLSALLEGDLDRGVAERLGQLRTLAGEADDRMREAVFALRAPGRDNGDLTSSVRSLLREIERTSGLDTDLVVTGEPGPGVARVQDLLHGVIKEALTNVVKHAEARMVLVSLRYGEDRVDLAVQDDGAGAPDLVLRGYRESLLHFGLRHMRERILEHGGTLEAANGEEGGLGLRVSVPLPVRRAERSA